MYIQVRIAPGFIAQRILRRMKANVATRHLRFASQKTVMFLNRRAKANIHKGKGSLGGLLKKSMGWKVKTYRSSHTVVGMVGPRKGFLVIRSDGTRVDPVRYAHIEEGGRGAVRPVRKRMLVSSMYNGFKLVIGTYARPYRGRPFLRPTLAHGAWQAKTIFRVSLWRSILRDVYR